MSGATRKPPPTPAPNVAAVFESYPPGPRRKLLALRRLILDTAAATDGVGPIEETLKWGEPAYLTSETGSGSTIRIAWKPAEPDAYAIYFHCQTTLVADFRRRFPHEFHYDGNRRIVFEGSERVAKEPLRHCIATALTYHLQKRRRAR